LPAGAVAPQTGLPQMEVGHERRISGYFAQRLRYCSAIFFTSMLSQEQSKALPVPPQLRCLHRAPTRKILLIRVSIYTQTGFFSAAIFV
jgi:hypothetical protein